MTTTWPRHHAAAPNDRVEGDFVVRFDPTERRVHWVSSSLVLVAVVTGLVLYVPALSVAVGRRTLVKDVHVVAGLASLVPYVVATLGPWRSGLRRDVERFAWWHADDWAWFRRGHRRRSETGKFNGGQKLNAALVGSAIVVMAATGSVMRWFDLFPLDWRTGATFVHDWVAFGLWLLIPAHIIKALITRGAVRSMRTGWQPIEEVRDRPRWWAAVESTDDR